MTGFSGIREGSWWIRSTADPRWNRNGRATVGAFSMPQACQAEIDSMKKLYGEMPADLEWGYMKD